MDIVKDLMQLSNRDENCQQHIHYSHFVVFTFTFAGLGSLTGFVDGAATLPPDPGGLSGLGLFGFVDSSGIMCIY